MGIGYVAFLIFWIFVLQIGKYLWIQGNKNFDSWAKFDCSCSNHEKKIMKRFRKSCRLVLICHGKVLVFGRMTQFVYIKSLIIYTCKLLIGFRRL